jgi:hypothetical protein
MAATHRCKAACRRRGGAAARVSAIDMKALVDRSGERYGARKRRSSTEPDDLLDDWRELKYCSDRASIFQICTAVRFS